jgi:hypothetical protein
MDESKRARSWKRRIQPRISLKNDGLFSTLPDRILMRLLVCRAICNRHWVEDNDICEHSLANKAAPIKS